MGSVYRAHDARLDCEVAIKVLGEHHAGSPEFVERFEREVKSVASLDPPTSSRSSTRERATTGLLTWRWSWWTAGL